jgi:hypothetical protein
MPCDGLGKYIYYAKTEFIPSREGKRLQVY